MCKQPTKLKPHEIRNLVNELKHISVKYHDYGCLRELLANKIIRVLKEHNLMEEEK